MVAGIDEDDAQLTATLTVTDENGETDTYEDQFSVEALDADVEVSDRVGAGTALEAGFSYKDEHSEAVDSIDWVVLDGDGEIVDSGTADSLADGFSVAMPEEFGDYTVSVDYGLLDRYNEEAGVEVAPPAMPGGDNLPRDLDGDGRYEDVDGDGEFTIFDVQALFDNFGESEVQEYAGAYDFDGDGEVTIFDVQQLFTEL